MCYISKVMLLLFVISNGDTISAQITYYVSSTEGLNSNDGLTVLTPKKDLSEIPKNGVNIFLKRGDVFWGAISGYTNCNIGGYGEGEKPIICGFKILRDLEAWENIGDSLWRIDLSKTIHFVGNIEKKPNGVINNIGFIYDATKDKIYGRNLKSLDSLRYDMDFFTSSYYSSEDINKHPFNYVILKSSKNPSELGNLCFPMYQSAVSEMKNCVLDGIAIIGFSRMGIVRSTGCTIENCQIDMIGGSIFIGYSTWCRYGNGIEFWYQYGDNTIKNCLISRTYDCATTIQSNGIISSNPRNIHFIGNRIYKCRQAFEHFLNPDDGKVITYEKCDYIDNVCYLMGENEFDTPELRDCNILSYESQPITLNIVGNTFFGANHLDGSHIGKGMKGNTVYIYEDQYLYMTHWLNNKNIVQPNEKKAIPRYREITHDDSKIKVLKRGSRKARRIEDKIRKQVDWKPIKINMASIIE